jgi:uncharacterized membrane protein
MPATFASIALVTYLTRVGGSLVLGGWELSLRTMTVLVAAPGCVPTAVIGTMFVSDRVADLTALGITAMAAAR